MKTLTYQEVSEVSGGADILALGKGLAFSGFGIGIYAFIGVPLLRLPLDLTGVASSAVIGFGVGYAFSEKLP